MLDPITLAIPFFFLSIGVEFALAKRRNASIYRFNDAITNLSCGIMSQMTALFSIGAQLAIYEWLYQHAKPIDLELTLDHPWLTWTVAFIGVDFLYYWWHRLSHEVNVLWAAHVVHHQSEDYNLAVALRQSIFTDWTSFPFYLPLAVLGVPTFVVAVTRALSTLYQFWIHTQLVGKIPGPLGWFINLPSHHRVHHATNANYLDKNYGAILIVWDRLFGTYADEHEVPVYGITKPLGSFDPFWAQVHYWFELANMAKSARRSADRFRVWFASPAWKPDGYVAEAIGSPAKYDRPRTRPLTAYVAVQFALVVVATFCVLAYKESLPKATLLVCALTIVGTVIALGALIEGRPWGPKVELIRMMLSAIAIALATL